MENLKQEEEKKRGKLIVLEGPDGFGKTTQTGLITNYLVDGIRLSHYSNAIIQTKEPGSSHSEFCLSMRYEIFKDRHPHDTLDELEEGLLFFLDHYHHARLVENAVEQGAIVVSDRWCYSQYCYNRVREKGRPHSTKLYMQF